MDLRGDQEEVLSIEKFGGYKTDVKERERQALRNKVKEEKHLRDIRGVVANKLKLQFRVGDLALPKRKRYTSSREEEDVATNMCPCGTTIESRTHVAGECDIYKEERDVLEMRKFDECDMEEFGRLERSEKTIAVLGDRWWPQTAKQDGDRIR